jgi:hypothetical protein
MTQIVPSPSPPIPFPNPLQNLDDQDLFDTQLVLNLACGRNKSVTREKHRTHLCYLAGLLHIEADHRGKPSPTPPFKA